MFTLVILVMFVYFGSSFLLLIAVILVCPSNPGLFGYLLVILVATSAPCSSSPK